MKKFNELNLSPLVMRAISELGYEEPSPIQAETLPILLGAPTDFLGLAATGTGKTAAFAIPMIEKIEPALKKIQALILCPTRELALQVSGQIDLLGKYKGVRALPIYGGSDYSVQIRGLKQGAQIVVGTPGRLVDHMERGTLHLDELKVVILDEADEMISMGFKEDLETLLERAPRESSSIWLFSATMSSEVRKVADEYLRAPKQVQVNRTEMLPEAIEQIYYITKESNKPEVLCKLIDAAEDFYGLVFCQTKSLVTELTQYLVDRQYKVDSLHGDKDQNARERTMKSFRARKVNLLICTDVASRGLDVKDITHVINYSIPRELDNYVHRIGRTARSGKTGFAMSLVTNSHKGLIGRIEKMTKRRMKEGLIPTRKEIGAKKIAQMLTKFQGQNSFARTLELLDPTWKEVLGTMNQEEIAGRFLSMMFPEIFAPNTERDSQLSSQEGEERRSDERRASSGRSREDRGSRGGGSYPRDHRGRGPSRDRDFRGGAPRFEGPRREQRDGREQPQGQRSESRSSQTQFSGKAQDKNQNKSQGKVHRASPVSIAESPLKRMARDLGVFELK